ncbi:hypothetical protein APHAL10511_000604 [Amanita phalloides]|nr:hypothetical protein APHAL10511_000604 [Amanita phalloides]
MDASHYNHQHWPPAFPYNRHHPTLSLNISSLSVASPASAALSPVTPISPNTNPFNPPHIQFQFDHQQYDHERTPPSRASSAMPRKRSFSANSASLVGYDVDTGSYTGEDISSSYQDAAGSSGSDEAQQATPQQQPANTPSSAPSNALTSPTSAGITLGKPMGTNNFVTKLYQMINDPKSQHFISWTDLGTSFVVSNVGEFSRSILGSHFKHNNFSSFVRQLNMYGFHKINRTPRAQRTSTDAQTWEFSHHKFLRGRPDLLDEIKRKALEPDPGMKHRIELPGEVAAQLNSLRDENRRMWEQLAAERRRAEKLVSLLGRLWDVVGKSLGGLPPFPSDILENDSPNIYVTTPSSTRFPPPLSISDLTSGGPMRLHTPNSSPTATDFHHHPHSHHGHHHRHSHHISRQQSFQHISFPRGSGTTTDGLSTSSTPLQLSPRSMSVDLFDDGPGAGSAGNAGNAITNGGSSNGNNQNGCNGPCPVPGPCPHSGHSPCSCSTSSTTSGIPSPTGRGSTKRQRLSAEDEAGSAAPPGGPPSSMDGSSDSLSPLPSSVSSPGTAGPSSGGAFGGGPVGVVPVVGVGIQHGHPHGGVGMQHGVGVGLGGTNVGLGAAGLGAGVGVGGVGVKKGAGSRARSDSAPLGYGGFGGLTSWGATGGGGGLSGIIGRPRSGSSLAGPRGVPNIGTMTRGGGIPPLSSSSAACAGPGGGGAGGSVGVPALLSVPSLQGETR